ncbi:MAG: hypothetical protein LBI12_05625, partial [Treponema sp.]|nr:hypothetical protein [Treponema sp.]
APHRQWRFTALCKAECRGSNANPQTASTGGVLIPLIAIVYDIPPIRNTANYFFNPTGTAAPEA